MKLLLDENLPKRLKLHFPDHQVLTVREMGWNGIKNGDLLTLMLNEGFEALLTFDKNIQHQQNFSKYPIAVFLFTGSKNTYEEMKKWVPSVEELLSNSKLPKGVTVIK